MMRRKRVKRWMDGQCMQPRFGSDDTALGTSRFIKEFAPIVAKFVLIFFRCEFDGVAKQSSIGKKSVKGGVENKETYAASRRRSHRRRRIMSCWIAKGHLYVERDPVLNRG
jgi:hypothetical protein